MPANLKKTCSLCGGKDHNVATCTLPGAQRYRDALRSVRPCHLKRKARVLRGDGVAASRKPGKKAAFSSPKAMRSMKDMKKWQKKQRKWYSGTSEKVHSSRKDRAQETPDLSHSVDTQCATQTLLAAGFLTKLDTCDKCGHGGLHGFFTRPGSKENGQLYYRCDVKECRAYTNVLAGCRWLKNMVRFRCINPSRLYLTIQAYTHKQNPRRQDATAFGVPPKAAQCIFDHLRSMEVQAAERQLKDMKLSGQVGKFKKKCLFSNTCVPPANLVKFVVRIAFFEANVFTCVFFSIRTCQCCRSKWMRPRFAHFALEPRRKASRLRFASGRPSTRMPANRRILYVT